MRPLDQDRDERIRELRFTRRWTEREIAAEVGMSPAGVHQACVRLSGKKRRQSRCRGCQKMTTLSRLDCTGFCDGCCRGGA